ncbi:MAG: hypothetical protein [Circular genetic element sp.]|nr:MAG: hypothetical protein [Circular genetic element sp.]
MNNNDYVYLQNKKWRGITVDFEILSTYSLQERLYCLNDFQVAWLLSNTEYMSWETRWENCPCTPQELQDMQAELDYRLMSCLDFSPYQLQTLYNDNVNSLLSDYDALWDGSLPSSVNPSAPDDFFDGNASPTRQDALCTALTLWGYSYAVDWSNKASIILAVPAFIDALVAALVPVGGNIATRVLADLVAPIQAQFDAMQDQAALDTVLCDWRDELEGLAINATNWNIGLGNTVYIPLSNEWYIQALMLDDTQYLDNFLTFVNSLGNGFDLANAGISICACFDCEVDELWDFAVDQYAAVWFPRNTQAPNMTFIPGVGWQADNPGGVQLATERYESIEEVEITYTFTGVGEDPRIFQYASSTGTLGSLIGSLPWIGNEALAEDVLVVLSAAAGVWTATINSIRVKGCRRP